MDLNNPLFVIPISVGIIFIIAGYVMLKFPPKKINMLYGYRTISSMKNKERWNFAQLYSSKLMINLGLLLALSSVLGLFIKFNQGMNVIIGLGMMFIIVIILFIKTEKAIKTKFKNE